MNKYYSYLSLLKVVDGFYTCQSHNLFDDLHWKFICQNFIVVHCKILLDSARLNEILQDSARMCKILHNWKFYTENFSCQKIAWILLLSPLPTDCCFDSWITHKKKGGAWNYINRDAISTLPL